MERAALDVEDDPARIAGEIGLTRSLHGLNHDPKRRSRQRAASCMFHDGMLGFRHTA